MNDTRIANAIESISKTVYLSDAEVRSFANKEFVPNYIVASDGLLDDKNEFAKGGLFDPTIFGKSELKTTAEHPKFGDNCGFYTFKTTLFNPMAVFTILSQLDLGKNVAYDLATCAKGMTEDFDIVPVSNDDCVYVGADTIKYAIDKYGITIKPEDLAMNILLIIPPRLRPVVKQGNGIAVSSINIMYQKVFNRADRYYKLMDLNAPDIILLNERRMLYCTILQLQANELLNEADQVCEVFKDNTKTKLTSLTGLLRGRSEKDREIINAALRISTNVESSVRQVRIGKDLLAKADEILKENNTNFSEVVRMLMQEIVDSGTVPTIVVPHGDDISAEERLFHAIFGTPDVKYMNDEQLKDWGAKIGLPPLSTATLAELFDSGLFPKDPYDGDYTALYPGELDTDMTNIDNRINNNTLYIEQVKANADDIAAKLKLNAIRYLCTPVPGSFDKEV